MNRIVGGAAFSCETMRKMRSSDLNACESTGSMLPRLNSPAFGIGPASIKRTEKKGFYVSILTSKSHAPRSPVSDERAGF